VTEIAPDVFRFCLYAQQINLQFNFFLVRDEQPLLFTTGFRAGFPVLRYAVAKVIDPARIRWIGFSHFESDECGALNLWLDAAPHAQPVCGLVSAMVNVNDFADRPPRGMADGEVLDTGRYRFRFCSTAQLPHGWDAGLLFEETQRTLFCSDLFHQEGDVEPLTEADLSERVRTAMSRMQASPLANYTPYTSRTDGILNKLADLSPKTLAIMHGSSFAGDGAGALRGLAVLMRDILGGQ
jgi:flavorubredoxin